MIVLIISLAMNGQMQPLGRLHFKEMQACEEVRVQLAEMPMIKQYGAQVRCLVGHKVQR